jgi:hypothetical protein
MSKRNSERFFIHMFAAVCTALALALLVAALSSARVFTLAQMSTALLIVAVLFGSFTLGNLVLQARGLRVRLIVRITKRGAQ